MVKLAPCQDYNKFFGAFWIMDLSQLLLSLLLISASKLSLTLNSLFNVPEMALYFLDILTMMSFCIYLLKWFMETKITWLIFVHNTCTSIFFVWNENKLSSVILKKKFKRIMLFPFFLIIEVRVCPETVYFIFYYIIYLTITHIWL